MLKAILVGLVLVFGAMSASTPCISQGTSKMGSASDCSLSRNKLVLTWGAKITFKVNYTWRDDSFDNILADNTSPRLPIAPEKSDCSTKAGAYKAGDSVMINCTQSFEAIPTGYTNNIDAFKGVDYPLDFGMKIPTSFEDEANLQVE